MTKAKFNGFNRRKRRRFPSPIAIQRARELVEELCIDSPADIDLELIAAHRRACILTGGLDNEVARLVRGRRRHIIRICDDLRESLRARFYIAHELGHLELHPELDQIKSCSEGDMRAYFNDGREPEANRFAAELLMPKKLFEPRCRHDQPSLDDLESLAQDFRTSRISAGIQFIQYCTEPCALVFSKQGRVSWATRSSRFEFFVDSGRRLQPSEGGTYAADLFRGASVPNKPMPVEASNWSDHREADGRDVFEHSTAWRDNDGICVLSLLRDRGE